MSMTTMQQYADQTPLNVARISGFGLSTPMPVAEHPNSGADRTQFVVTRTVAKAQPPRAASTTPTEFRQVDPQSQSGYRDGSGHISEEAETVRDRRLRLLVAKFEHQTSLEDDARLQLLTARLRRLAPRVTQESLDSLNEVTERLEGVANGIEAMRRRLGVA
ncbi:hypothetical protein [Paraburkholderia sediminicola]|uniref:hypothetical protein n=1 Tax=Paraburkholderia sediminicola TaxID=458836 RepID=UPI0038BD5E52